MRKLIASILVLASLSALLPSQYAHAGTFLTRSYNGRTYKLFVPNGYAATTPAPLIVMLHGCSQDADAFAHATQLNTYADTYNFLVAYPQQGFLDNFARCWNWFDPVNQARGSGELGDIAGIVGAIAGEYAIDADNVYVAGFSAGATMAVLAGAAYPDVFAAIGVHAGLEYKAATNEFAAWSAMLNGGPDPDAQGTLAYHAMGDRAQIVPTIVFHGTNDFTVAPINGDQVLSQWAQTNDWASDGIDNDNIDDVADQTLPGTVPGGRGYTRYLYANDTGERIMEKIIVDGMGHNWSGGATGGSFTDPAGPNASVMMLDFFFDDDDSDFTPPITSVEPAEGTYDSPITVTFSTNEPATTYYRVGTQGTITLYTAPFTLTQSTTLFFASIDESGNQESVRQAQYQIGGDPPDATTFTSLGTEDGYVGLWLADGYSTSTHQLGDKGFYNSDSYRTILSFDTSALPEGAAIAGATLRIYRQSQIGTINSVSVDIKSGTFGAAALELSDYSATATVLGVVSFVPPSADDAYVDIQLPPDALAAINPQGRTQFRLRAATPLNYGSDVLTIYGGESDLYAPLLIVYTHA